jgi:hypothetical protein
MMKIENTKKLHEVLKSGPYAWPGGYPLFFLTQDGAALSFEAVKQELEEVQDSIECECNDGWRVVAVGINWEDENLLCDHTGEKIQSAYGEANA